MIFRYIYAKYPLFSKICLSLCVFIDCYCYQWMRSSWFCDLCTGTQSIWVWRHSQVWHRNSKVNWIQQYISSVHVFLRNQTHDFDYLHHTDRATEYSWFQIIQVFSSITSTSRMKSNASRSFSPHIIIDEWLQSFVTAPLQVWMN